MEYTKGEWEAKLTPLYTQNYVYTEADGGRAIALTIPNPDDARLIAAAPDMREALEKIASCDSVVAGDVIDIAQQALAKVEEE